MNRWKRQIKRFFNFNRTEQRGIAVLLLLILGSVIIRTLLPHFVSNDLQPDIAFRQEITMFEKSQKADREKTVKKQKKEITKIPAANHLHPFPFDPNGLPVSKWKELGLTDKQITMIKNYEAKGGKFRKKEDLAKIYSISEEEYAILEPFITIDKPPEKPGNFKPDEPVLTPFVFDPNVLDKNGWLKTGLDSNLVNRILKYREKGGRFYKKEDLKRIYGLKKETYAVLEPFIRITVDSTTFVPAKELAKVEINSADTLELQQLKGIGPAFAKRIVKYRNLLGGYYRKEQLLEVFGMDSVRYNGFIDQITLNKDSITKININTATVKQLLRHPYIDFYIAKKIISFRNEHTNFVSVSQLKDSAVLYDELYKKIEPYLEIK